MRTIPALERAMDVLELFIDPHHATDGMTVPEIVRALGIPRTSAHEIVNSLIRRGYLAPTSSESRRYRLGVLTFHLGRSYADAVDLAKFGHEVAREISAECSETVHVAVLERSDVVYVAKVDSTHAVRMVSGIGRRIPANCTAVGKMLLSSLSPDALTTIYPTDQPLPALTSKSITRLARLRTELDEIRRRGYSIEEGESNDGVACIAAPVYDESAMVAAMSISVPLARWRGTEHLKEYGGLVRRGAQELSAQLGGDLSGRQSLAT